MRNASGVVPELCPRQTHSSQLKPGLDADFDCLFTPSDLGLSVTALSSEGEVMVGKTISHYNR
jgi:hypothetical protein